jgi:hypothetical protein
VSRPPEEPREDEAAPPERRRAPSLLERWMLSRIWPNPRAAPFRERVAQLWRRATGRSIGEQ